MFRFSPNRRVAKFNRAFGADVRTTPDLTHADIEMRLGLVIEELEETRLAYLRGDIVEVADGIGDLLVVVYGFAQATGINADKIFKAVHKSNMTKLGADGKVIRREDGKILKGPNFKRPTADIKKILGITDAEASD